MNLHRPEHTTDPSRNSGHLSFADADVLVAGLGGMGVVGLTQRIGTLLRARFGRVFTKESRGFAQRRASVTGAVRAGRGVRSPELVAGANLLLVLEGSEALRHERMVRPGARVVVCDSCVWPSGFSGRDFEPVEVSQIEQRLARRGAQVLSLPVCRWLKEHGLPEVYASSAMLGAFAALVGMAVEQVASLLGESWKERDREGNLAVCRWAHGHVLSLLNLGQVAEAA